MISIGFKAEFRRGSRELVENAVARQISVVFEDSLSGIKIFQKKRVMFVEKYEKSSNFYEITENQKKHPRRMSPF